jgi:hypothetical protein
MKTALKTLAIAVVSTASAPLVPPGHTMEGHRIVPVQEIKWGPAPASIPPGGAAVLYGDPSKEGLFALRLKLPKGYHIAPHTHPKPEVVTIISGGSASAWDKRLIGAGLSRWSQAACSPAPSMAHFVYADEETVIQLNSNGPWRITYVNAKDDPRQSN